MDVEKVNDSLAAGIKTTGGEGEGDDSTPTPEQDIQSYRARLESEGHRSVAAKHYRSVLNRIAAKAGGPPIALGELDVGHLAEHVESLSRYRDQLEETNSALTVDRTGMAAWAASHEHHEEHHRREEELEAEIERLRAECDVASAERDALKADLARAESFAAVHEAWEACMVSHNPAWEPGGMAEFPRLVQPLWDAALGLQDRRNRVLEVARQAGRVGSAGDLGHAWEAVRGLAGLDPDPKAEGVESLG